MSEFLSQDNVDTELFPSFVEEAQETIKNIESALHAWHNNKADTSATRTLRRAFHTLKGASNIIGHFRIGRVASAMKSLLESIEPQRMETLQPQLTKITLLAVELIKKLLLDVPTIPHLPSSRPIDVEPLLVQIETLQKTVQLAA